MNSHLRNLTFGLQHQQNGRLLQAAAHYRRVLQDDSENPDALHLLGVVAHRMRDNKAAIHYIARAIEIRPAIPQFHCSLGNVFQDMGLHEQAVLCYRSALSQKPDYLEANVNLGNSLQSLEVYEAAVPYYLAAIQSAPLCAEAYNSLGNASLALGRKEDSVALFRHALTLKPDYQEAGVNLAAALHASGASHEAVAWCRDVIRTNPRLAPAHAVMGSILSALGRYEESGSAWEQVLQLQPKHAEACCNLAAVRLFQNQPAEAKELASRALAIRPEYPEALNNLGQALFDQSYVEEARSCVERALCLKPRLVGAWCNLGNIRKGQMDWEGATACFRQAVRLDPTDGGAHLGYALVLLARGDFDQGWSEYEWRWQRRENPRPSFSCPPWDGAPPEGRTILVRTEQGLGDTIQFVRYLPLLKRYGARVILECQPRLLPLLGSFDGADDVIGMGCERPDSDFNALLMSLPHLLHTRADSVPDRCPYLRPDPELTRVWGERLADAKGMRIAISWAGNPRHRSDRRRSFSFSEFEPLLALPGISWVSLQQGEAAWQLTCSRFRGTVRQPEDEATGIADTAAIIANVDLVISADTMVGHLAGALGKPVWLMLCAVPDWRWMLDRADSPWYPTMRLFRQAEAGAWAPAVERIRNALLEWVGRTAEDAAPWVP